MNNIDKIKNIITNIDIIDKSINEDIQKNIDELNEYINNMNDIINIMRNIYENLYY